jgi:protein-S-isoprenylcysteine O-methyltransferase Ste14
MSTGVVEHEVARQGWIWSALRSPVSTALVALLFGLFAYSHVASWLAGGHFTGLVFALQESVLVVLFLTRRRTKAVSQNPTDWVAGFVGTFLCLLLRPVGTPAIAGLDELFFALQLTGAALSLVAAMHLGRSFGIIAANRGVKDTGAYGIVRHPLYAAYIFSHLGYLLSAPSLWNMAILGMTWLAMFRRITAEEQVLQRDPAYRSYAARVRFRLIPELY